MSAPSNLLNKNANVYHGTFHGCQMTTLDFASMRMMIASQMPWKSFNNQVVTVLQVLILFQINHKQSQNVSHPHHFIKIKVVDFSSMKRFGRYGKYSFSCHKKQNIIETIRLSTRTESLLIINVN